jgi:hypothetical protein
MAEYGSSAPELVFLYGPPACGKFTVGRLVADALKLPFFHNHLTVDPVLCLFPFGSPGFRELRADFWRAAFAAAGRHGSSLVFTFNPEATVEPALLKELWESYESHGGRIRSIALCCSEAAIEARLGSASRRKFGKLTDLQIYRQAQETGQFDLDFDFAPECTVDTTVQSPEEAAKAIVRHLRDTHAI